MAKKQRSKKKLWLFVFAFIFFTLSIIIGLVLLDTLYPEWKQKIPKPFKEIIVENQTVSITEIQTTEIYPAKWGFWNFASAIIISIIIVGVILAVFYAIMRKGNIFFKHNLKKCQKLMFNKLSEIPNTNIHFEDKVGTWSVPFSFFFKEDIRTQWAGSIFSLKHLGPNQPFNKYHSILTICSMNDPENKFFYFPRWDINDLIKNFHIVSAQQPWARLDAVKLDITMPFELPEFQEGMKLGIKEKGKEAIAG